MSNTVAFQTESTVETLIGTAYRKVWKTQDGEFLVSSSADGYFDETHVFPSDSDGEPTSFYSLGVSDHDDHEGALADAGYRVSSSKETI